MIPGSEQTPRLAVHPSHGPWHARDRSKKVIHAQTLSKKIDGPLSTPVFDSQPRLHEIHNPQDFSTNFTEYFLLPEVLQYIHIFHFV
nr:hypothetical protein CFP56_44333 [Quercus suber]